MTKSILPKLLYSTIQPYQEGYLKVSSIHELWYGQYGNPNGVPVIVLHGGPGAGCSDDDVKFFDPSFWRIILLDQRASRRSKPFNEMEENTTQHLISDLDSLRKKLLINQWVVFGGSWGSALAIAYGQNYPNHILGFILRGIFLARQCENLALWYGMRSTFPDAWQELNDFLPIEQQQDLISAYHRLVMSSDINIALPAAQAFMKYDVTCSFLNLSSKKLKQCLSDNQLVLGLARTFIHYSKNHFFLRENQLIDHLPTVNQLPLIIVHGRYDTITRAESAYELHQLWPGSELNFVEAAGHSAQEKKVALSLARATEKMKTWLK